MYFFDVPPDALVLLRHQAVEDLPVFVVLRRARVGGAVSPRVDPGLQKKNQPPFDVSSQKMQPLALGLGTVNRLT